MDESTLIKRAKTDKEAFGELYEAHIDRIYRYVYYRVGNQADAEDLTARVFERAINNIATYEDKGVPFSAWLYRIAHNLVANHHRDRQKRPLVSLDTIVNFWSQTEEDPETFTAREEKNQHLLKLIQNLSDDKQQLLHLKYIEQYSNAEIGEIMGRSEGAIKSLYHRTLAALRDEWMMDEYENKRATLRDRLDQGWIRIKKETDTLRKRLT